MGSSGKWVKDGEFTSQFDGLVSKIMSDCKTPGISLAVINDESVYAKGYGFSKLPDVPVTNETLFNCGSMSKAFTAASVSMLVDDNDNYPDVQWTAPVSSLIREDFVLSDYKYTEQVTVEDILSHRSGLPNHDDACLGVNSKTPDTSKSVTRKLRYLPLNVPLRTKFQYSNLMYVASAHLVETLTGQWIGDFVRQRIWEPLRMGATFYGIDDLKTRRGAENLAQGYRWDKETKGYIEVPWIDQPEGSGAGEMISNPLDYAEFLKCMIHKAQPISTTSHEELVTPRIVTGGKRRPYTSHRLYALGWETFDYHGETIVGHSGGTNGFTSNMIYLPRLKWGFVAFGNSDTSFAAHERLCWELVDEFLNVPSERRWDCEEINYDDFFDEEPVSREELFPNLPDVPRPLSLPLQAYIGEYHHRGYGTLVVKLKDGKLYADATDRTWRFTMSFDHASGEFFFVEKCDVDTADLDNTKAQFRLEADFTVKYLGVALVGEMKDEMIWFQRKEGGSGQGREMVFTGSPEIGNGLP